MTIGMGIFLSTVVASSVALFIATKDRWNWKRIALWSGGVPLALAALFMAGIFVYETYSNRPRPQFELWGIRLGMSKSDVVFLKGAANSKPNPSNPDKEALTYSERQNLYRVFFSTHGIVEAVVCIPDSRFSESIQGVGLGDSLESVLEKFGRPSYSSESRTGLKRILHFSRYKVFFGLSKGVVESFGIDDAARLGFMNEEGNGPRNDGPWNKYRLKDQSGNVP